MMAHFRPIAIVPVLVKVYSRIILLLTDGRLDKLSTPQFAFRAQYQAHEAVFLLHNLVEKLNEWDVPIFVLDGDIFKAYDHTRHQCVIDALRRKKVPRILIAAWLREWRRCSSVFQLGDRLESLPVSRSRSLLQGDPSAPALFNATLDMAGEEFTS